MGLLQRIFGSKNSAESDARQIYSVLMGHSRNPELFGDGRLPDNYDGRIEALTLHLSVLMERLSNLGEDGRLLSQSLFDVMVDDFNVALREEGLTDTGIKHRIKPMVGMFYKRLKGYSENFSDKEALDKHLSNGITGESHLEFQSRLRNYVLSLHNHVSALGIKELTALTFDFPKFT